MINTDKIHHNKILKNHKQSASSAFHPDIREDGVKPVSVTILDFIGKMAYRIFTFVCLVLKKVDCLRG
jgi:hypothetical protein